MQSRVAEEEDDDDQRCMMAHNQKNLSGDEIIQLFACGHAEYVRVWPSGLATRLIRVSVMHDGRYYTLILGLRMHVPRLTLLMEVSGHATMPGPDP